MFGFALERRWELTNVSSELEAVKSQTFFYKGMFQRVLHTESRVDTMFYNQASVASKQL